MAKRVRGGPRPTIQVYPYRAITTEGAIGYEDHQSWFDYHKKLGNSVAITEFEGVDTNGKEVWCNVVWVIGPGPFIKPDNKKKVNYINYEEIKGEIIEEAHSFSERIATWTDVI